DWLTMINTRRREPPRYSPAALIAADRKAMRPLPAMAPPIGWKVSMRIGQRPVIHFDGNDYVVDPVAAGRTVELSADLSQIQVVCGPKVVANHERAWARGLTIRDSLHWG